MTTYTVTEGARILYQGDSFSDALDVVERRGNPAKAERIRRILQTADSGLTRSTTGYLIKVQRVEEQQATIAVAVTVKLTARGSTPEELISNAAYDADRIVESALRTSDNTQSMTVEGATALVNRSAIERMFS